MAEYYMKNPHFAKRLNLEKGKIVGYNPKIKIDVPKNVDTDFLFNIRINFTPGYVTIPDDKDQKIIEEFFAAFPKVTFSPGFGISMPKDLKEKV